VEVPAKSEEPEVTPSIEVKEEKEAVEEEIATEEAVKEELPEKSEDVETESTKNELVKDPEAEVKGVAEEEATESTEQKVPIMEPLLELAPVFLHTLVILWTVAFATMITFSFDWWVFQLGPIGGDDMVSQKGSCFTLGLWLVTIIGNAIAFGAESKAGWILTGSSFAVASFSTKFIADGQTTVPFLPIYSFNGIDVCVLPALVVLCMAGFSAVLKQPVMLQEQPQVVVNREEPVAEASEAETQAGQFGMNEEAASASDATTGPQSFIGQRVAVEKGTEAFFGIVTSYDSETREWSVHYVDESQEDEQLNRVQLGSAFKLHSKRLADNLKEMWRAGEL